MYKWLIANLSIDEQNLATRLSLRSLYKWILDLLRNLAMVAALSYVAAKSGSWFVWSIAAVAGFALCGYCFTYIEVLRPNPSMPSTGRNLALSALVLLLIQLTTVGVAAGMFVAIDRIVKAQLLETHR